MTMHFVPSVMAFGRSSWIVYYLQNLYCTRSRRIVIINNSLETGLFDYCTAVTKPDNSSATKPVSAQYQNQCTEP